MEYQLPWLSTNNSQGYIQLTLEATIEAKQHASITVTLDSTHQHNEKIIVYVLNGLPSEKCFGAV